MAFDVDTELYIPFAYCLMSEYSFMPNIIASDFELGLISTISHEFPESHIHGCYFQLNQAKYRKIRKYPVNEENCRIILSNIELLTVASISDIPQAILFIKSKLIVDEFFNAFWSFFKRTWMSCYNPNLWNLSIKRHLNIQGRTNNALESYNRRLGNFSTNAHQNICAFVSVIRSEVEFFSDRYREIRQNYNRIRYRKVTNAANFNTMEFDTLMLQQLKLISIFLFFFIKKYLFGSCKTSCLEFENVKYTRKKFELLNSEIINQISPQINQRFNLTELIHLTKLIIL
ncbi:hypothetical protein HZS_414 [Henneguya salminicola]|nr:hypothetical protein HZS_414 [Henneguya salminicola]